MKKDGIKKRLLDLDEQENEAYQKALNAVLQEKNKYYRMFQFLIQRIEKAASIEDIIRYQTELK